MLQAIVLRGALERDIADDSPVLDHGETHLGTAARFEAHRVKDGLLRGAGVVRPERVQLVNGTGSASADNTVSGVVRERVYVGALSQLDITLPDGGNLQVVMANDGRPVPAPGGSM